jgi:hypothetical protein
MRGDPASSDDGVRLSFFGALPLLVPGMVRKEQWPSTACQIPPVELFVLLLLFTCLCYYFYYYIVCLIVCADPVSIWNRQRIRLQTKCSTRRKL